MTSKDEFFNSTKLSSRDKAAATDTTAKAIITAEAAAREKKTEALKALRLQHETEAPAAVVPAKKRKAPRKSA
ncbi:hypothetical protein [Rhizobium sp. S96]|jgi:hypothetical protein|uniref:hypothetical protein n=1 Tax=Rhizobium sp. S96 TaxID=3055140 RepID=UPI0025AABFAB|nr:hypothetical protein [Rhizobium sp. S96]MDM9620736.1 hypothetical protein [Rhizobium sp. S96]